MNRIVWCNGTFDILHPEYIELFKVGKSLGDKLIVATDTDEKIRQDKGETSSSIIFVTEFRCYKQ